MKRSEMLEHIKADLEEMLVNLKARPRTRPHITTKYANNILDMLEGFGMLPPEGPIPEYKAVGFHEWEPEE